MSRGKGFEQKLTVRLDLEAGEIDSVMEWMEGQPQERISRSLFNKITEAAKRMVQRLEDKR